MKDAKKKKSLPLSILAGLILGSFFVLLFLRFCSDDPPAPAHLQDASSDAAPSLSQDLMGHLQFLDVPDSKKDIARQAAASVLRACPRIAQYATHGETPSVSYYPEGWEGTSAHIEFDIDLAKDSQVSFPQGMKDPQWSGHVGLGVSGDGHPGIYMHSPLEMWICGIRLSHGLLQGYVRKWPDRVHFLPVKDIPHHSF